MKTIAKQDLDQPAKKCEKKTLASLNEYLPTSSVTEVYYRILNATRFFKHHLESNDNSTNRLTDEQIGLLKLSPANGEAVSKHKWGHLRITRLFASYLTNDSA